MGPTTTLSAAQAIAAVPANGTSAQAAKVHRVAKQFEAMFMTEMLHQSHGKSRATGVFRAGEGETAMQPFMDQALGDAMASRGGTGLAQSIEQVLGRQMAARSGK
jgi:flagellar protein FlgJ